MVVIENAWPSTELMPYAKEKSARHDLALAVFDELD